MCCAVNWTDRSSLSTVWEYVKWRRFQRLHQSWTPQQSTYLQLTYPYPILRTVRVDIYLAQQTWWSLWCGRSSRPAPATPGVAAASSAALYPPRRSPQPLPFLSCLSPPRVAHLASRWAEPPAQACSVSDFWWPLVARPAGKAAPVACPRASGGVSDERGGATHSLDSPAPPL